MENKPRKHETQVIYNQTHFFPMLQVGELKDFCLFTYFLFLCVENECVNRAATEHKRCPEQLRTKA